MTVEVSVAQPIWQVVSDWTGDFDEKARRACQAAIGVSKFVSDRGAMIIR